MTDHSKRAGRQERSGWLAVVGLGPGDGRLMTDEARATLSRADVWVGYGPYLERAVASLGAAARGVVMLASDNREELSRAREALVRARSGDGVALISGGDPGLFGMSAAFLEVYRQEEYRDLDLRFVAGISAFQAASMLLGAPLGGDFAILSLSTNLKPLALIERRLKALIEADMAFAIYNPASKSRRDALPLLSRLLCQSNPDQWVIVASDMTRPQERVHLVRASKLCDEAIGMESLLIVGATSTSVFYDDNGRLLALTPRQVS